MDKIIIRGREYEFVAERNFVRVKGQIFSKGGSILPNLRQLLCTKLNKLGFPVAQDCQIVSGKEARFPFSKGVVGRKIRMLLGELAKSDARCVEINRRFEEIVRRYNLLHMVGLDQPSHELHNTVRALETEWNTRTAELFDALEHVYKYVLEEERLSAYFNKGGYWYHKNVTPEPEDEAWLREQLANVSTKIDALF